MDKTDELLRIEFFGKLRRDILVKKIAAESEAERKPST